MYVPNKREGCARLAECLTNERERNKDGEEVSLDIRPHSALNAVVKIRMRRHGKEKRKEMETPID